VKRLPFFSLLLLLAAYCSFSWFMFTWFRENSQPIWPVWVMVIFFALAQALLLTAFAQGFRSFMSSWLKSDIGYFSMIALGAFSITVILVWIHVFEYILMLVGAEVLARLNLQHAGCDKWLSLIILTVVSLGGLAIGWEASHWVGSD
jgi:hypothetical protein